MGNKKFKSLQLVRNGELKQALEEGASEVVPVETPQITPSESIQTNVKMMEKITEKAKTLEEYDKVIEDFRQVMRDWATTRYVYLTASETMDENTQTFKDTVQNTKNFVKTFESICERICEIICRVERIVVETKLNDEDAELIRQYQSEVVGKLTAFMNELQKSNESFLQKETEVVKAHNEQILQLLKERQQKMLDSLKSTNGVWFSFKSFIFWATIAIPSMSFTGMYLCGQMYLHWIPLLYNWFINLFH